MDINDWGLIIFLQFFIQILNACTNMMWEIKIEKFIKKGEDLKFNIFRMITKRSSYSNYSKVLFK